MAINIDGTIYRNIQQQVAKNTDDIDKLKERVPSVPYGVLELELEGGSGTLTDKQYDLIADRRTVFIRPNTSNAEDIYFKCKEDDTYFYFVTYVSKYTYTQQGKTSLYQEDFFVSKEDKSWGYSNMFSTQFYDETQANNKFLAKANLTDDSILEAHIGNSLIDGDNVDLNALYSQDVKSQVSLEPNSTVIRTMSGTDVSTIGISATEVDITTPMFKYGTSEVATKADLSGKQDTLVSGTNIKTINNDSILSSGNISLQPTLVSGVNIKTINNQSLLGSGNLTLAGLTENWFKAVITFGNDPTEFIYMFRAKTDFPTGTYTGYDVWSTIPAWIQLFCPTDNCVYSIAGVNQTTTVVRKYDGTQWLPSGESAVITVSSKAIITKFM